MSFSLEATYIFALTNGALRYHNPANGYNVATALNLVKRNHPVIVLALLSVIMNAARIVDGSRRSAIRRWAFNALSNCGAMHTTFGGTLNKKERFTRWANMSSSAQRNLLEALRTGSLSDDMTRTIDATSVSRLFRVDSAGAVFSHSARKVATEWENEYSMYIRIARKYNLTREEFEYYLTIPSARGRRVFYPFWHHSRAQAAAVGWDWYHVYKFAYERLNRMRTVCNKPAEDAGLGEKIVDEKIFVYWMVSHFCALIAELITSMPSASRSDILEANLDRWDCPIVPWVGNILCASICKKQDHGIAMLFGIREGAQRNTFDPVRDIDLAQCTVTIDTGATNVAMWNWKPEAWLSIRKTLESVPLEHPLWKIDNSLGQSVWGITSASTGSEPTMPDPAFKIPLLSIDSWFSGQPVTLQCTECGVDFQTIGQQLYHFRNMHASNNGLHRPQNDTIEGVKEQETRNATFWEGRVDGLHLCGWTNCDRSFRYKQQRDDHQRTHTGDRLFACDKCDFQGLSRQNLRHHKLHHTKPIACTWPGCTMRFANKKPFEIHYKVHEGGGDIDCPFDGCNSKFSARGNLIKHLDEYHLPYVTNLCPVPGCKSSKNGRHRVPKLSNLLRHIESGYRAWYAANNAEEIIKAENNASKAAYEAMHGPFSFNI